MIISHTLLAGLKYLVGSKNIEKGVVNFTNSNFLFRVLVSTGATGAAAPVSFGQRVHAPINFQA